MRQKHTKILASISGIKCTTELIQNLHDAGIDAVRLNTAHMNQEEAAAVIKTVRSVSDRLAILIDTKGPEVRLRDCPIPIDLADIETINISYGTEDTPCTSETLYVNYEAFVEDVQVGHRVLIDDGEIEMEVASKTSDALVCKIIVPSIVKSRKSVNAPASNLTLPSVSEKDKEFLKFAVEQDVDFIAHSFVRDKHDVIAVKEICQAHGKDIKIIAKIENRQGVDNADEILDESYGLMIARGDLGVELCAEEVPLIQKKLIERCASRARVSIVATQMLESMIEHPRPTRAEVSDIANGVLDGADCLMLSGETAYGNYPVKAVAMMSRTIKHVESKLPSIPKIKHYFKRNPVRAHLGKSAALATEDLPIKAVLIPTVSGASVRIVSSYRIKSAIFAKCFSPQIMRELRLSYGVFSDLIREELLDRKHSTDELVQSALQGYLRENRLAGEDLVVVLGVVPGEIVGANFLTINTVNNILGRPNTE